MTIKRFERRLNVDRDLPRKLKAARAVGRTSASSVKSPSGGGSEATLQGASRLHCIIICVNLRLVFLCAFCAFRLTISTRLRLHVRACRVAKADQSPFPVPDPICVYLRLVCLRVYSRAFAVIFCASRALLRLFRIPSSLCAFAPLRLCVRFFSSCLFASFAVVIRSLSRRRSCEGGSIRGYFLRSLCSFAAISICFCAFCAFSRLFLALRLNFAVIFPLHKIRERSIPTV